MSILITRLIKQFGVSASFVKDVLEQLVKEGQIKRDHINKISYIGDKKIYTGVVQAHKNGYGFLICDEDVPDLYIPEEEMDKVLPDDRVAATSVQYEGRDQLSASLQRVISRKFNTLVGILRRDGRKNIVVPEDPRIGQYSYHSLRTQNLRK